MSADASRTDDAALARAGRGERGQPDPGAPVTADGSLIDWPANQALGSAVARAKHRLLDTGLFTDDKLIELFDRHDPGYTRTRLHRMENVTPRSFAPLAGARSAVDLAT
jgi:hypothetical protein